MAINAYNNYHDISAARQTSKDSKADMNIIIYSQPNCAYCEQSKALLKSKGIDFTELILNVGQKQEVGKTYVPLTHLKDKLPEAKSVPQIFNGKYHIGGFAELREYVKHD
jgi:glutaredoxin 3